MFLLFHHGAHVAAAEAGMNAFKSAHTDLGGAEYNMNRIPMACFLDYAQVLDTFENKILWYVRRLPTEPFIYTRTTKFDCKATANYELQAQDKAPY